MQEVDNNDTTYILVLAYVWVHFGLEEPKVSRV